MTKTIHLNLPPAVHKELKEIADELDIPITALLRLLIRWWLKQVKEGKLNPEDLLDGVMNAGEEVQPARRSARSKSSGAAAEETSEEKTSEAILEKLLEIQQSIEAVKRSFEDKLVDLESQLFELQEELRKLKARVHRLEDAYEDLVNPVQVEHIPARR